MAQVCNAANAGEVAFQMAGSDSHAAAVTTTGMPFLFADGYGFVGAATLQNPKHTSKPLAPLGRYERKGHDVVWVKGGVRTETLSRNPDQSKISRSLLLLSKDFLNLGNRLIAFDFTPSGLAGGKGGIVTFREHPVTRDVKLKVTNVCEARAAYMMTMDLLEVAGCAQLRDVICLLLCIKLKEDARDEIQCGATEGMWLIGVTGVVCLCGRGAL